MKHYSVFASHDEARCFKCDRVFDGVDASDYGYPVGRWAQECPVCQVRTWYDIKQPEGSR